MNLNQYYDFDVKLEQLTSVSSEIDLGVNYYRSKVNFICYEILIFLWSIYADKLIINFLQCYIIQILVRV